MAVRKKARAVVPVADDALEMADMDRALDSAVDGLDLDGSSVSGVLSARASKFAIATLEEALRRSTPRPYPSSFSNKRGRGDARRPDLLPLWQVLWLPHRPVQGFVGQALPVRRLRGQEQRAVAARLRRERGYTKTRLRLAARLRLRLAYAYTTKRNKNKTGGAAGRRGRGAKTKTRISTAVFDFGLTQCAGRSSLGRRRAASASSASASTASVVPMGNVHVQA